MSETQEELFVTIPPHERERVARLRQLLNKEQDDVAVRSAIRIMSGLLEDFHSGADLVVRNRDGALQTIRITDGNGGRLKRNKELAR